MIDSRLKGYTNRVTHPTLPLERTFCSHCGRPKGWVSVESYEFIKAAQIIVLCDDCEEKLTQLGPLPLEELKIPEWKEPTDREIERILDNLKT